MNRFAALFATIDQSTKTTVKVAALADYFRDATEADRIWTIALFSGRRPKRAVTTTKLREWAADHLAKYKLPLRLHIVDALPRNPAGKVLKFVLKEELTG